MTEELKPCPWCGDPLTVVNVVEGDTFRWRRVQGCCADGPEVRHDTMADDQAAAEVESHAAAITAWNTRPESNDIALLSLLADIRKAAGDPTGKLMQDELVASIAALRADSERLNYIERTFSGMTCRERYLPVTMIWGKGCNGRTIREACDKYMKRDAK